jgi:hypothetical protein
MISPDPYYRKMYDFELRECIGKTDDIHESLCMHSAIVAREMAAKGVVVCRICNCDLSERKGRYNDHKVLRHPECIQPICNKCAHERPDAFHLAFLEGGKRMRAMAGSGFPPSYLEAARTMYEVERDAYNRKVIKNGK